MERSVVIPDKDAGALPEKPLKAGNRERDVIVLNLFGVGRFIGLEIRA